MNDKNYLIPNLPGFMKPGITEHTVSNFGLLDQIAALQWIKENIDSFDGDANRVTLMGHGTGGSFVNFLMVSPVAVGSYTYLAQTHAFSLFIKIHM